MVLVGAGGVGWGGGGGRGVSLLLRFHQQNDFALRWQRCGPFKCFVNIVRGSHQVHSVEHNFWIRSENSTDFTRTVG